MSIRWLALLAGIVGGLIGSAHAQTFPPSGKFPTTTNVACATASTTLLAANHRRILATTQSQDGSNPVWICFASTCTVARGVRIDPGNSKNGLALFPYEYEGPLSCIATGGLVSVVVVEVTP